MWGQVDIDSRYRKQEQNNYLNDKRRNKLNSVSYAWLIKTLKSQGAWRKFPLRHILRYCAHSSRVQSQLSIKPIQVDKKKHLNDEPTTCIQTLLSISDNVSLVPKHPWRSSQSWKWKEFDDKKKVNERLNDGCSKVLNWIIYQRDARGFWSEWNCEKHHQSRFSVSAFAFGRNFRIY